MDLQFNFLGSSLQLIAYYSKKFYCHLFWSASNDGVDTADRNSTALEMMPIINLFNEWHASSTSKKIKAVVEANAKAGKYGCKQAAYGYIKGDDEKHTPIINPETAPVVLSIFKMRAQGISPRHIADKLNEDVF